MAIIVTTSALTSIQNTSPSSSYLAICKALLSEAGLAGDIYTTSNQVGELSRICNWVNDAYQDIQDKRQDWNFLRYDFTFSCDAAVSTYSMYTIANLANWKKDSFRCYSQNLNDEQWLTYVPWDVFRDTRLRGAARNIVGRPIEFSIKPDRSLVLFPTPDSNYTVDGEYYCNSYRFENDTDMPIFSRFTNCIKFNALMRAAAWLADPTMYTYAQKEYGRLLSKLEADNAPIIYTGSALA
jgi:hypothetical protein